jgi:hypothetical protein
MSGTKIRRGVITTIGQGDHVVGAIRTRLAAEPTHATITGDDVRHDPL